MNVTVIHNPERTDRRANIDCLRASFPNLQVLQAQAPLWETSVDARCLRGCTASHLLALRACPVDQPLLVLEDDAVLDGEVPPLESVPSQVGMVLLGGEAPMACDEFHPGYRMFLPPFFGSQAILYMPHPNRVNFLVDALFRTAVSKFGKEDGASCAESVIFFSGLHTRYPICRPNRMVFTTLGDRSESFDCVLPPRRLGWTVEERPGLLPQETWDEVFEPWRGRSALLLRVPGNAGDVLINAATKQLLKRWDIQLVHTACDADVIFYPGGGSVGTYGFEGLVAEQIGDSKAPLVILPQSLGARKSPLLAMAQKVWVRDEVSSREPGTSFAPDLALAYRTALASNSEVAQMLAFREDQEATGAFPAGGDPTRFCTDHYQYIALALSADEIHTDRLHFAISGLIAGRKVTLYPNNYHKNRSVWEASLRDLGCQWKDKYL